MAGYPTPSAALQVLYGINHFYGRHQRSAYSVQILSSLGAAIPKSHFRGAMPVYLNAIVPWLAWNHLLTDLYQSLNQHRQLLWVAILADAGK